MHSVLHACVGNIFMDQKIGCNRCSASNVGPAYLTICPTVLPALPAVMSQHNFGRSVSSSQEAFNDIMTDALSSVL